MNLHNRWIGVCLKIERDVELTNLYNKCTRPAVLGLDRFLADRSARHANIYYEFYLVASSIIINSLDHMKTFGSDLSCLYMLMEAIDEHEERLVGKRLRSWNHRLYYEHEGKLVSLFDAPSGANNVNRNSLQEACESPCD